jgi:hypothetical protein
LGAGCLAQSALPGAAAGEDISSILGGRPLLALAFNNMTMVVNEPEQLILPVPAVLM